MWYDVHCGIIQLQFANLFGNIANNCKDLFNLSIACNLFADLQILIHNWSILQTICSCSWDCIEKIWNNRQIHVLVNCWALWMCIDHIILLHLVSNCVNNLHELAYGRCGITCNQINTLIICPLFLPIAHLKLTNSVLDNEYIIGSMMHEWPMYIYNDFTVWQRELMVKLSVFCGPI